MTTIRLNAPFPAELLPCKDYTLRTNTRVLDFLTKVDIAVAPCDPASGHLGRQDVSQDIPSFIEALPTTLKDLSLALPLGLRDFLNPLDDCGFQRLLDQGVHFPELHSLSLGNIGLFETHTLRQFLIRHHASLRLLHLSIEVQRTETSLALLRDIEASLQLKRFDLDDLFSEADKLTLRALWMPESRCGRRTRRLLRGTAEDVWYNGIHIDAKDPTLDTEEASGYLDLNSFNIAAEQSGTAAFGDEEDEEFQHERLLDETSGDEDTAIEDGEEEKTSQ